MNKFASVIEARLAEMARLVREYDLAEVAMALTCVEDTIDAHLYIADADQFFRLPTRVLVWRTEQIPPGDKRLPKGGPRICYRTVINEIHVVASDSPEGHAARLEKLAARGWLHPSGMTWSARSAAPAAAGDES